MAAESGFEWVGQTDAVDHRKGRLFELGCLAAALFGIVMVAALLVYVTLDALEPWTADPLWFLVYGATFGLPVAGFLVYARRAEEPVRRVALSALGLPLAGVFVGAMAAVVLRSAFSSVELFAHAVGVGVAAAVVYAHRRLRPAASAVERITVAAAAFWLALVGVPSVSVAGVTTPTLLDPVSAFVLVAPYLPTPWMAALVVFGVPVAAAAGYRVQTVRESARDGRVAAALVLLAGAVAGVAAAAAGVQSDVAVVVALAVAVPTGLFVEQTGRAGVGQSGLAFPVVVFGGIAAGALLTSALGVAGPDAWLDWQFLISSHSRAPENAGIYPAFVGSVMMIIVIALSAFPVGVGAAVYLEEYAPSSGPVGLFVSLIRINIGNLAGVPSVVYGLLGLALFVRWIGMGTGTVIVGGFTVGLLILPIVIISAQEAIRAVPDSMRQASYGMGATRWQTVREVVLPEALPGILTGTILALGRAIGETAPLIMIGAATTVFSPPRGFFDKFSAMPQQIYAWVGYPQADFQYGVMAAGVVTLLTVLLGMNAAAILVRNRYQRRS